MNSKVDIKGDVGVAINAEQGSSIHINISADKKVDPEFNRAIHVLLKTCEEYKLKSSIEAISQLIFETDRFKNLTVDQLSKLQIITEEFNEKISATKNAKANFSTIVSEQQFFDLTGIRASAPARDALMLLLQEDVTSNQIALLWKKHLHHENGFLELKIPKSAQIITIFCLIGMCVCTLFAACAAPIMFVKGETISWFKLSAFVVIEIMSLGGAAMFAVAGGDAMRPYRAAHLIKLSVDKVNTILSNGQK